MSIPGDVLARSRLYAVAAAGMGLLVGACGPSEPKHSSAPPPPPPPPPSGPAVDSAPPARVARRHPPAPRLLPAGAPCTTGGQCRSRMCQGKGCWKKAGRCLPRRVPCTSDVQAYCGCDGKTFRASGSCPLRLYKHRGPCQVSTRRCTKGSECPSGICEGLGCEKDPGYCVLKGRKCVRFNRPFCGCDGKTFSASSNCPNRLYRHRGACRPAVGPVAKRAVGARCRFGDQCKSGICEGKGCGPGAGRCVSRRRKCTGRAAFFCGCNGKTIRSVSNCPWMVYRHRGACRWGRDPKGRRVRLRKRGSRCAHGYQCVSGICEGKGCRGETGRCTRLHRLCTRDRRAYCSCDGKTFFSSGSCPGGRYKHGGRCGGGRRRPGSKDPLAGLFGKRGTRKNGARCARGPQCRSGICEGRGCHKALGRCEPRMRACTAAITTWCGCDGKTFRTPSGCAGRRYRHRGSCRKPARKRTP